MDLGSAVMSASCALEGVEYPVLFSDAPLVEGAVMAAVEAAIGSDLTRTAAAAESARGIAKDSSMKHSCNEHGRNDAHDY